MKLLSAKSSALTKLLHQFQVIEGIEEDPASKNKILLKQLQQKGLISNFRRIYNREKKKLDAHPFKDVDFYEQSYRLEEAKLPYFMRSSSLINDAPIEDLIENFDYYYLLKRLKLHILALSLEKQSGENIANSEQLKAIQPLLKLPMYTKHPLLKIYSNIILMLETDDDKDFESLMSLLEKYQYQFSSSSLKFIYDNIVTFCSHKINAQVSSYGQRLLEIYQFMYSKDILCNNRGYMHIHRLRNMIEVSCMVRNFEWAFIFLEDYFVIIDEDIDIGYIENYLCGIIAFHQQNFQRAAKYLEYAGELSPNLTIDSKLFLVKSLYEADNKLNQRSLRLFRQVEVFFIKNKTINPTTKRSYRNFIRILTLLYKIKHKATRVKIERISEKMEKMDVLSNRGWLAQKTFACMLL